MALLQFSEKRIDHLYESLEIKFGLELQ